MSGPTAFASVGDKEKTRYGLNFTDENDLRPGAKNLSFYITAFFGIFTFFNKVFATTFACSNQLYLLILPPKLCIP